MNILIASIGRRVNIVRYFKESLKRFSQGQVLVTDCSPYAAGMYEADKSFVVPRVDHSDYLTTILDICKNNDIDLILSLIDPELVLLAENKDKFRELGVEVLVSNYEAVDISFNKYKTAKFLVENNIPFIKTFKKLDEAITELESGNLEFPLMVKPAKGSSSVGLNKVANLKELKSVVNNGDNYIIQEFIEGEEYGVDVFIDNTGEVISVFAKKKLSMRAGETDQAVSIKDEKLFDFATKIAKSLNAYGPLDIDCFKTEDRGYIFSEINPRFGGGYPLAYEAGANFMELIIKMMQGEELKPQIGDYIENRYLFKYNGLSIVDEDDLINDDL
ncbi:ATP-grasp domain-containing protein [Fuchsiella alkaliacetigena]|uniref:ATP-grasp domain-containing protein n=1 Tax=Fuchsiella alkaliacetigena TaxID=957042 RepID=UPI00200B3704|nr:ATP-grasp domain-containing protein [Fuchsiella alkaliacetigena]MCK8824338.1 ATP-grasp domain-containing protein [Fuchsiella alkaliacetigena]